jgi:hypothetical protein
VADVIADYESRSGGRRDPAVKSFSIPPLHIVALERVLEHLGFKRS